MDHAEEKDIQLYKYSSIRVKKAEWLWYPYIPIGKITLLTGDPGDGKSLFILNLVALLTAGKKLPDGTKARKPINAIYQSIEDSPEDTIKPRLLKAGADCNRVYCFHKENGLYLNDRHLEKAVSESKAKLVIFDPIQSFIPDNVDMMNAANMRGIMNRLTRIAENCKCAIILICHLNKGAGGKNLYRMLGSIDIAAAARSVLMINRDALRWCVAKPDKRKSRKIIGRQFTKLIYEMMDWDPKCRYKITGHRITFEGEQLYVFELDEPEIYHERPRRTKEEKKQLEQTMTPEELDELKKKEAAASRKPFYPDDVENSFGVPVDEHEDKIRLADPGSYEGMNLFTSMDKDDGGNHGSSQY